MNIAAECFILMMLSLMQMLNIQRIDFLSFSTTGHHQIYYNQNMSVRSRDGKIMSENECDCALRIEKPNNICVIFFFLLFFFSFVKRYSQWNTANRFYERYLFLMQLDRMSFVTSASHKFWRCNKKAIQRVMSYGFKTLCSGIEAYAVNSRTCLLSACLNT